MAGNANSDSVLWVAGETTGHDVAGNVVTIASGIGRSEEAEAYAYTDAAIAALRASLVASGVL